MTYISDVEVEKLAEYLDSFSSSPMQKIAAVLRQLVEERRFASKVITIIDSCDWPLGGPRNSVACAFGEIVAARRALLTHDGAQEFPS